MRNALSRPFRGEEEEEEKEEEEEEEEVPNRVARVVGRLLSLFLSISLYLLQRKKTRRGTPFFLPLFIRRLPFEASSSSSCSLPPPGGQ